MDSPIKSGGFRLAQVLILILLAIPSAAFLWRNSDLPQFGEIHDDSLYYVSAKSLASGSYRIESLPNQPYQTKYPPLYPLLLSVAWHLNPHFPENLPIAAWLSWLALPVMLALLAVLYPEFGFDGWRKWLLLAALALNPYVILFSSTLLSELWFTALLALTLWLVERSTRDDSPLSWAVAAGLIAGLAYLTRSAGIVLLASGPLYLWLRHQRSKAIAFGAAMFPFVACWMLWTRLHQLHTTDPALIYYTDYVRYEIYNFSVKTVHLFLWKNIDGLVSSLGYEVLPNVTTSLFMKILADVLGVAMISGIVRMVRKGQAVHYAIFAAGSAFMLVIWHFPPNERFVLPLVPLAFAGLLTELEHFAEMARAGLKHRDSSQRVASAVMLAFAALVFLGAFALQGYVGTVFMNGTAQRQRQHNIAHQAAYSWIRQHLAPAESVLAFNDPVLYLYTSHRAISRPLPPYIWYTEDHDKAFQLYREIDRFARAHGASYVYLPADLRRDMGESDIGTIEKVISTNAALKPVLETGAGTLYRVAAEDRRPNAAYTAAPAATITNPGQVVAGR